VGYVVTGRSGDRGYVQRLAVDPTVRRAGLGAALVVDGLRWLRRRHTLSAVVNTQVANDGALALYRRLGFILQPDGLIVLTLPLVDAEAPGGSGEPW
jgi:ribosomal protein S18 acetylase RimI-like enzyme